MKKLGIILSWLITRKDANLFWIRLTSVVLAAAGCAKIFSEPASHGAGFRSLAWLELPATTIGIIELVGGSVIFATSWTRFSRFAAVVLVVTMVAFTGWNVVQSGLWARPDCGCWGSISVSPRVMAAMDAVLAAGLLQTCWRHRAWTAPVVCGWLVMIFSWIVVDYAWSAHEGKLRNADLDRWIGYRFPALDELGEAGVFMSTGQWLVMIYDHTCGRCRSQVAHLVARHDAAPGVRTAVLCVSSCEQAFSGDQAGAAVVWVDAQKAPSLKHVTPPLYLLLEDGRVHDMAHDLDMLLTRLSAVRQLTAAGTPAHESSEP
ncbi:MAG: hypothetical protein KatS3mg110_1656 [Pirellulaceae bacterium]|nr:MAG: hypothetical protein KatS3mg110_1656 [Pirellulaceae bacterium]